MVKLAGAIVVCAAAAFVVAFFAAGAGKSTTTRVKTHPHVVPFADSAASAVAVTLAGHPAALKLPPPRHVKHHVQAAVTVSPPAATTPSAPAPNYTPPAYVPPAKHKSSSGTGHGTTTVGP